MSQFSTMSTRERKIQAAAICREFHGQEDIEMDLGKKMSVPKEIMLEELSLSSNRGSRLFKMRQRRSEKYTFESIRNENNKQLSNSESSHLEDGNHQVGHSGKSNTDDSQPSKAPIDTPDTGMVPNPGSIAPGYAGPLKDIPPEKFNSTAVPKSYSSPWEQAINSDPALAGIHTTCISEPEPEPARPGYKSFNRVAMPFGGFSSAPRHPPAQQPQMEALPDFPELQGETKVHRPSFNRSALGWGSPSGHVAFPAVSLGPVPIPESDDL